MVIMMHGVSVQWMQSKSQRVAVDSPFSKLP